MGESFTPWKLPRLSMATARLTQQLCTGRTFAEVPCLDGCWRVRWLPLGPYPPMRFAVHGRVGEEPFTVWLDNAAPLLSGHTVPDADSLRALPDALAAVMLECSAATLLQTAESFFGKPLMLDSIHADSTPPQEAFGFVAEQAGQQVHGALLAPVDGVALPHLSAWWQHASTEGRSTDERQFAELRIEVIPVLREWALPAQDLRTLRVNDFLVGPGSAAEPLSVRCYIGKHCFMSGTLEKRRISMDGEIIKDTPVPETLLRTSKFDENTGKCSLAEIPLQVSFALDAVEMTIGQLTALRAGQVFITDCDPEAPVTVLVNGQCLGHGRLVDVSGRLAVQITECRRPHGEESSDS